MFSGNTSIETILLKNTLKGCPLCKESAPLLCSDLHLSTAPPAEPDEDTILMLMEMLALSREEITTLLIQFDNNVENVIASSFG